MGHARLRIGGPDVELAYQRPARKRNRLEHHMGHILRLENIVDIRHEQRLIPEQGRVDRTGADGQ